MVNAMNRIFISYRSSDGKKDADRLCADLSRLLGDEQVFYDKQDLAGGTSWRTAIEKALGTRPVVLLLLTPDLFGMNHPDGGRRIDREDDPIRNELLTAHQSRAIVVPLLTEGMVMPQVDTVPPQLRFILETHALKLRTDDWATDLQRLLVDLRKHGVQDTSPDQQESPIQGPMQSVVQRVQRWLMYIGGGFVALLALGYLASDEENMASGDAADPAVVPTVLPAAGVGEPSGTSMVPTAPQGVSGLWWSIDPAKGRTRVLIAASGSDVSLTTDPIPVAWYPQWQAYALRLREQGVIVNEIRYFAAGNLAGDRLQMTYRVYSSSGGALLDNGSINLGLSADGRELTGQIWSIADQVASPLQLVR